MGYGLGKLDILGTNEQIYSSMNWSMYGMDWPMTFQNLIAEMSYWDGTQWISQGSGPITAANKFYPMCFPLMEIGMGQIVIMPTSATLDDFKFLINNDTSRLTGWFPFDTVIYNITDNILNMTLKQSGNGQDICAIYNSTSGLLNSQAVYYLGDMVQYWEMSTVIVEWSVNFVDIILNFIKYNK